MQCGAKFESRKRQKNSEKDSPENLRKAKVITSFLNHLQHTDKTMLHNWWDCFIVVMFW